MWEELKSVGLIQQGCTLKDDIWIPDVDQEHNNNIEYRLNVDDMSFELYQGDVCYCPVSNVNGFRPSSITFKGRSPYSCNGKIVDVTKSEDWGNGIIESTADFESLHHYIKEHRPLMWDYLWGENNEFSSFLDDIYNYQDQCFFIQAEHTAQIDKEISAKYQNDYREHMINILACSTTMEMGVDIGQLQVVVMNSVPPYPANYKQRAGRSGRRASTQKSLSVTLCGSDSIGARTLRNPLKTIVNRPVTPPRVSLYENPTIVKRHINSYCLWMALKEYNRINQTNLSLTKQDIRTFYTNINYGSITKNGHTFPNKSEIYVNINGQTHYVFPSESDPFARKEFKITSNNPTFSLYEQFVNIILMTDPDDLTSLLEDTCFEGKEIDVLKSVLKDFEASTRKLYDEIAGIAVDLKDRVRVSKNDPNFVLSVLESNKGNRDNLCKVTGVVRLLLGYSKILDKRLLDHLCTSRFIPNANMPVDVIEFDVNYSSDNFYGLTEENNPSYSLKDALYQYSPGNNVILKNSIYTVGGMSIKGRYQKSGSYISLYRNSDATIISENKDEIPNPAKWDNYNREDLRILRPRSFMPDFSKNAKRVSSSFGTALVSKQLIGAEKWADTPGSLLFDTRASDSTPNARILYYNEGLGYGFCYCKRCGKIVPEYLKANKGKMFNPPGFNDCKSVNGELYHMKVHPEKGLKNICSKETQQLNGQAWVMRNMVIGDFIQTDFTEFKFYDENKNEETDERFLNTMGILICLAYSEKFGINRQDIDFTITSNKRLCVFDATPGGSGYCNKLVSQNLMFDIFKYCKQLLGSVKSNSELLDKYTIAYEYKMDRQGVSEWLDKEEKNRIRIPQEIVDSFEQLGGKNLRVSSLQEIELAVRYNLKNAPIHIFVSNEFNRYNFDYGNINWKALMHRSILSSNADKYLYVNGNVTHIPTSTKMLMQKLTLLFNEERNFSDSLGNGIYPLAFIDGVLYFTTEKDSSHMDARWASANVYQVNYDLSDKLSALSQLNIEIDEARECIFKIEKDNVRNSNVNPTSANIAQFASAETRAMNLIEQFSSKLRGNDQKLHVYYQDQHLKSELGIVAAFQFIEYFLNLFKEYSERDIEFDVTFELETYSELYNRNAIFSNLSEDDRNGEIERIFKTWVDKLPDGLNINQEGDCIRVLHRGQAPHWRNFTFECDGTILEIDPNGGIINEWFLDKFAGWDKTQPGSIDTTDRVPLYLKSDIKYSYELYLNN